MSTTALPAVPVPDFYGTSAGPVADQQVPQRHFGVERPWRYEDVVPRDHNGRPYIIGPDGRSTTYTRCTTFVDEIDKGDHLQKWRQRMLMTGFALRPTIAAAEVAGMIGAEDERKAMNAKAEELIDAGGGADARDLGSAVHALTERHDLGLPTPVLPDVLVPHLDAWVRLTLPFEIVTLEQFMVQDELRAAGTPDRIWRMPRPCPSCGRPLRIGDLKGGRVDDFSMPKIGRQMAVYQHCALYDHETGVRTPVEGLCTCFAYIVSIPSDSPQDSRLLSVPTEKSWEHVTELIPKIREARRHKPKAVVEDALLLSIQAAPTEADLRTLWSRTPSEQWLPGHTEALKARLLELSA